MIDPESDKHFKENHKGESDRLAERHAPFGGNDYFLGLLHGVEGSTNGKANYQETPYILGNKIGLLMP